jgi:hypothetical protein
METENLSPPQGRRDCLIAALNKLTQKPYLLLTVACLFAAFAIDVTTMSKTFLLIFTVSGFSVLTAIMCFTKSKKLTDKRIAVILIAAGFLLRLVYILYTTIEYRQHDVWSFSGNIGHAGYIKYIYENLSLPDTDPIRTWQFYHAPLHHIIAALWLRLNVALGLSFERACENIQILTLFYSTACTIIIYRILNFFKLKGNALLLPLAIACFHPTFAIMGGCINNDMLSVTLAFAAVLATLRWYDKPTIPRIIAIALCIGFSMMAKTNGGLVAPAVAFVFLIKLIKDRKNFKKYLLQFTVFGVICIPLGLWWSIYNYVKWGMPIGYVAELSKTEVQYLGQYTTWQRFFSFNSNQFADIFVYGKPHYDTQYCEYNIFVMLFKSSVFGESYLFPRDSTTFSNIAGNITCYILFFVNVILALTSFVGSIVLYVKDKLLNDKVYTYFFLILWGFMMAFYFKFCLDYPFTCSMDFRYVVPTLLVGIVFLGKLIEYLNENREKKLNRILSAGINILGVVFCISSINMLCLLGI